MRAAGISEITLFLLTNLKPKTAFAIEYFSASQRPTLFQQSQPDTTTGSKGAVIWGFESLYHDGIKKHQPSYERPISIGPNLYKTS